MAPHEFHGNDCRDPNQSPPIACVAIGSNHGLIRHLFVAPFHAAASGSRDGCVQNHGLWPELVNQRDQLDVARHVVKETKTEDRVNLLEFLILEDVEHVPLNELVAGWIDRISLAVGTCVFDQARSRQIPVT